MVAAMGRRASFPLHSFVTQSTNGGACPRVDRCGWCRRMCMSDEKPPVRHAGSQAATRAAATLNWLAIGGLVGAVVSDVIARQRFVLRHRSSLHRVRSPLIEQCLPTRPRILLPWHMRRRGRASCFRLGRSTARLCRKKSSAVRGRQPRANRRIRRPKPTCCRHISQMFRHQSAPTRHGAKARPERRARNVPHSWATSRPNGAWLHPCAR